MPSQYVLLFSALITTAGVLGYINAASSDAVNKPVPKNETPISLSFEIQPILNRQCVYCHFLEAAQGDLNLEDGFSYEQLVGVDSAQAPLKRILPGFPEESYLIHKLRGTHLSVGGSGQAMPAGGEQSSGMATSSIELIESWIRSGAPEN